MTQKIALLSDVHGNRTALEAVLKDAKNNGVTECWFLGDLIMPGPGGNELFELLESNNTTVFIKGNWDDCFLEVLNDPQNINLADSSDVYVGILSKYTKIHLKKIYIELLNSLNIVERRNIFGLDVSISHNLPEKNYGPELMVTSNQSNFDQLVENEQHPDIAIYGHVHTQLLRYGSKGQMILNPGTIGQPFSMNSNLIKDRRAQYAILELDQIGVSNVIFRKVSYDIEKEIKYALHQKLPYLELYKETLTTGITHTHDLDVLGKINKKNEFVKEMQNYLNS